MQILYFLIIVALFVERKKKRLIIFTRKVSDLKERQNITKIYSFDFSLLKGIYVLLHSLIRSLSGAVLS